MLGALALGTVGCSIAPPAQFYQLQQTLPETGSRTNNTTVLLGPLKVADYLQRESIMQREADGSLVLSQEGLWAGNMQDDVGQLLLRQISAELGTSRISLYPDRIGMQAQAQVILNISRLDSGVEQPAVLEAQWRLLDGKGVLRNSRVVHFKEEHDGTLSDQVRAQSELIGRLSVQLVQALAGELPAPVVKTATSKPAAPAATQQSKSKTESNSIPVVEPAREVEVYRF